MDVILTKNSTVSEKSSSLCTKYKMHHEEKNVNWQLKHNKIWDNALWLGNFCIIFSCLAQFLILSFGNKTNIFASQINIDL